MSATTQNAKQYWDERSELFGNYYQKPSLFDKVFRKGIFTRVAVALKTCRSLDKPTVLDIGSGPGINSVTLLKNSSATNVVGIDFAPSMIEYANRHAESENVAEQCEFIVGDFVDYEFDSTVFDLSIALGVLDYVEDASTFLKKMSAVSEKAGPERSTIKEPSSGSSDVMVSMALRVPLAVPVGINCTVNSSDSPALRSVAGEMSGTTSANSPGSVPVSARL